MRSRLEHLSRRLVELDAMLAEPDAANDMNQFRKLSRERSELEPVVKAFEAFESAESDLAGAREMLEDPEMKAMALDEIEDCKARIEKLGDALQLQLLPRDPDEAYSYKFGRVGVGMRAHCSPAICYECIPVTLNSRVGKLS